MKVSIITVVHNNVDCIAECIQSVLAQTYENIEYIVIDGQSSDGTMEVINRNENGISKIVSEEDNGFVHAFNKGLELASGDVIGFLNSDDIYADEKVIESVVEEIKRAKTDSVYGDLVYVKRKDTNKIVRYWRAGEGDRAKIVNGWMPPHPSLFIKKDIYEKYGYFNTDFEISTDYEIILRFLFMHRISMSYLHRLCVKMRIGGISNRSLRLTVIKTLEDFKACKIYGLKRVAYTVLLKNLRKIPQFLIKGVDGP